MHRKGESEMRAADLQGVLLEHAAVHDAVVLSRRDLQGNDRTIAYVVPADPLAVAALQADLKSRLACDLRPDAYVFLTAIPLDASGSVDADRLQQYEVMDERLVEQWARVAGESAGIRQVQVVPVAVSHHVGSMHRSELVSRRASRRPEDSSVPARAAASAIAAARRPEAIVPAIAHGEVLTVPDLDPLTLGESLRRAAARQGQNGVAYVSIDGSRDFHSYPQLLANAQKAWASLAALGLQRGDKVMLQLSDNRDFLVAFWGCVLGGMVPVPVSIAAMYEPSNATVQKLVNAWRMLEQPLIIASPELVSPLRAVLDGMGARGARLQSIRELPDAQPARSPAPVLPDDLALLLLTSGSTGTPKAVMHSHRTLLHRSAGSAAFNDLHGADVSLNWMPLDHVGGIVMFHLHDVFTGCMQVQVATGWIFEEPLRWLDLIEEFRATVTWAPNFAYALVADKAEQIVGRKWDLSTMRFILNGGEPIAARTAKRFLRLLAPHALRGDCMHPAWGMSETASGITYSHAFSLAMPRDERAAVEVGGPIPNTSLRIVDEHDRVIGEEEKGRLQVRGASIMLGYYQNPELNRKVFTPDGWFDTGDAGFLRDGRLTLTARTKDDIIINGVNYLASEIEAVADAVAGVEVSYSAACAVRRPESDTDELAVFFSPSSDSDHALARVLRSIRSHVAKDAGVGPTYLVPLPTAQIPRTAIGKIQRPELKRRFEAGEFDAILKRADELTQTNTVPEWFYRKVWRPKAPHALLAEADLGTSLVLSDDHGLGSTLCTRLREAGQPCVAVEAGAGFLRLERSRYRLDPANRNDYVRLVQALHEDGVRIRRIVHLWTFERDPADIGSMPELIQAQQRGVYSVLHLVQALAGASGEPSRVELHVVSSGAQITSSADQGSCTHAAVVGLLKTIPHELGWLRCRHIDLEVDTPTANAGRLLAELRVLDGDDEVAYRGSRRLVWRLAPVDLRAQEPQQPPIAAGGIYLITGGLGGIGACLAGALLREYQAKLILVGTTRLPPRAEWPASLERGGKLADRIRRYLELESLGGQLAYECADVADAARLYEVVAAAEARWGSALAGVFHLAADADIGSHWQDAQRHHVSRTPAESFDHMFRAKVYGSWALYQLVKQRPAATMMAFGSVLGIFGAASYGPYVAAHAFLRNFVLRQRNAGHARSHIFSWTAWDDLGMSKGDPAFAKDLYRSLGYFSIPRELGLDCLLGGLRQGCPDLIVGLDAGTARMRRNLDHEAHPLQALAAYVTTENDAPGAHSRLADLRLHDPFGTQSRCDFRRLAAMPLTSDGGVDREALGAMQWEDEAAPHGGAQQPRTAREEQVAAIWREVLAVSRPGIDESFFQLGGNSLRATEVLSRVRQAFQVRLDMRDLFEHATIAELSTLIEQRQQREQTAAQADGEQPIDPETLLAGLAQMSDARVSELLQRMQGEGPGR
jgi:acyl-CoA synthetase (AMP-forming)/AMP-acid ligase II/NAD(P)-dependent dehydrogenase (short-subunit alcohol dehydrogenase family)/acyl carrier protein